MLNLEEWNIDNDVDKSWKKENQFHFDSAAKLEKIDKSINVFKIRFI